MPLAVLFVATLVAARTAEAGDKNRIKKVSFDDQGQSTTVRIKGSATPTFTVYKLERPNRVVLDIAGAELGDAVEKAQENGQTIAVATWAINQIAAYELDDGGALVRIVVTLARPGRYDVTTDGDDLVVSVVARDDAPAKADPEALAEAKDAEAKAKKDSETAKTARTKAEADAAKAREQAEASKKEAEKAKKALAEAKAAAAKAEKAGKADRESADRALAEAKAEADRTKKAAAQAKAEADRTKKSVAAAQAEAERTKKAAAQAKADVERMQAEVIAAKAEAKAKGKEAAAAKADAADAKADAADAKVDAAAAKADAAEHKKEAADAKEQAADAKHEADTARADAAQRKKEAAAAKADAAARKQEAEDARAEAERNKVEAAAAKAEADRRTKEAEQARDEARKARADADAAQKQAADKQRAAEVAQQEAADQKRAAAAAKKEAAADKRDAAAMRAEAEQMLAEAKDRASEAAAEAKAAKKSQEAAFAAQKQADKSEAAARKAEAKAAEERKAAQAALDKAEKAKAAGDADADTRVAAAEARLRKAEQARIAAEDQRKQAESVAETARDEATRRKAETAEAVAAKGAAETERKAAQHAADEAEQRAARAEELRKDEVEAARRAAEAKVAVEDAERAKAGKKEIASKRAEAKRLAKEASEAKRAREGEESQLAAVIAERRQAEKDLDKARTARAEAEEATKAAQREAAIAKQQAEDARREADEAKRQAQVARDDAEQAKVAAGQARDAEKAARKAATAEKAAAKKAAAAERAAAAEEAATAKKEAATARKEAAKVARKAEAKPVAKPVAKPAAKPARVAIRDVAFQQDGDDARVIVELDGEVDAEVVRADRKSAELVLSGVDLPSKLQRKLDVSKFDGAVRAISSFQDPDDATKVRVVVELSGDATPRLETVGNTLRWHFTSAAPAVAKSKPKAKGKSKGKTQSIPAPVVGGYGASSAPVTSKSVAQAGGSRRKVYRGPTIDLDFKDADIHNLLRFLANIGRVSIVVPDDIKATVTVRLKRVPWDQALDVILASKGLWYRKEGSLYRIAPRKQLDAEDQAEAERVRAAVQSEAPEAEVFTLNYASAAETQDKLEPLLSPKGKIEVDTRTNSLIINDIRSHRRRIIDLAARLDTQTPQIMIEARIVEARSTYAREFGIQWGGRAAASQAGGNATGLIFPNSIGIGGGADDRTTPTGGVSTPSDFAVNLPATVGTGAGGAIGLSLGSVGGNFNLNLRLSAAEDTGTVRIISSPKITVLNNTEASISQGVSIPISVVSASGTQTQFVPADLALTVTPYVSQRDCSIAMTISVTKNEPDFVNTGARGDPTILRKEANTRILVADGETTVMGGITTRNTGLAYNKVPFLGDLPVIGWFFKSRRENDDRTELLIFITPTITNKAFLRCE